MIDTPISRIFILVGFYIVALVLTFFGQAIGDWTGVKATRPSITKSTPGCFIKIFGYIFIGVTFLGLLSLIEYSWITFIGTFLGFLAIGYFVYRLSQEW